MSESDFSVVLDLTSRLLAEVEARRSPDAEYGFTIEFCCSEHVIVNLVGPRGSTFTRVDVSVLSRVARLGELFDTLTEMYERESASGTAEVTVQTSSFDVN